MNFASDNTSGASPEIIAAVSAANTGAAMPYGADDITARVAQRLNEVFETQAVSYPVATGTAANSLALAAGTPPWGAVYCHGDSHINRDECGAPELFTGGAKLVPLEGDDGKVTPAVLEAALAGAKPGFVHQVQPAMLSLTNATEAGTVYTPDEVAELAGIAHAHGLKVHMDGARFANAAASLGCTPAELTWKAGVDVLAFGATKNGALAAEAVVFFDRELAENVGYRRKRAGHLFSKMRFLSAQLEAYLSDGLWLANASHANAMAARLAAGLSHVPGCRLVHPVQANELFVEMPAATADALSDGGCVFYRWKPGDPVSTRFVTSFNSDPADVDRAVKLARSAAGQSAAE
ncbi:threonine aldolase family protein [Ferruginivarius sediminum]|uniref:L-threonine aldolase n=1 Tax=Ferruginivarius sediminum TaxID=2661937 RepID=A0A369T9E4_9PROT|nr:low specificity L-threonine aldolase [Ferruginivarius sediminum]RDD61949.1 low specificity L-threonine aldolase [Ferruginivarius sediminum]